MRRRLRSDLIYAARLSSLYLFFVSLAVTVGSLPCGYNVDIAERCASRTRLRSNQTSRDDTERLWADVGMSYGTSLESDRCYAKLVLSTSATSQGQAAVSFARAGARRRLVAEGRG